MNNLHEALEVCLEALEQGMDIETALARYPNMADELRPILQASMMAREKAAPAPSADMMRRNRAKLLQRAAVLRAAMVKPAANDMWFASLRRLAVIMLVFVLVFGSGAGLVRASSTTLPGDNLYPVKRTWEEVALLLTFDLQKRESLEVEHENERLKECHELIAEGRSAEVDFAGIVTQQNGDEWLVSGITIVISSQTDFHDGPVFVGDAVRVFGTIQSNDSVLVERIDQLPSDAQLPNIGNSGTGSNNGSNSDSGSGKDDNGNDVNNENNSSGPGNGNDNNNGSGGGNDNENSNNSGSGTGIINSGNDSNSGPGSSGGSSNDNSNDDNSGSGSGNSNEDNSGSGSGSNNTNDDNSGSGGGGD